MSNKRYFKRSYHLRLKDELTGNTKDFSSIDIKFHVNRMVAQQKIEATIDILGLTVDSINLLTATSVMSPTTARQYKKRITLTAGYEGNEVHIFSGYVTSASVDQPPEMWVHIKADNIFEDIHEVFDISCSPDMTAHEIFEYCAKQMGMTPKDDTTFSKNVKPGGLSTIGTKTNIIQQLTLLCPNWQVFFDNGLLYAVDTSLEAREVVGCVCADTGLLAVSGVTYLGCDVVTWLANDYPLSQWIEVKSQLMPSANGKYRIMTKEFKGHFRGKEWYTTYHTIRRNK